MEEFTKELVALLKKYDAEIETRDYYSGYAECGEDVHMTVYFNAQYDKDGNTLRPWSELNLGSSIGG